MIAFQFSFFQFINNCRIKVTLSTKPACLCILIILELRSFLIHCVYEQFLQLKEKLNTCCCSLVRGSISTLPFFSSQSRAEFRIISILLTNWFSTSSWLLPLYRISCQGSLSSKYSLTALIQKPEARCS